MEAARFVSEKVGLVSRCAASLSICKEASDRRNLAPGPRCSTFAPCAGFFARFLTLPANHPRAEVIGESRIRRMPSNRRLWKPCSGGGPQLPVGVDVGSRPRLEVPVIGEEPHEAGVTDLSETANLTHCDCDKLSHPPVTQSQAR